MGRWWDTDMASAGQALYTDPSMALDVATTPDDAFTQNVLSYTKAQQDMDRAKLQQDRGGFLNTVSQWLASADSVLSKVPGWGVTKQFTAGYYKTLLYPVDKAASGAHWLYSNVISQPLSTLILQAGKADLEDDLGVLFSGDEWSEAYEKAEHISPGQASYNVGMTQEAKGEDEGGFFETLFSPVGPASLQSITAKSEVEDQDRARYTERMIYDTEYWRNRTGWKYTAGTGASDFALVLGADPTTYATGGIANAVKGARSLEFIAKEGGEIVRTRGALLDTVDKIRGKQPQTLEEVGNGKQMQDFFDWIDSPSPITGKPRKSAAEIEAHPIWGRGRRKNNFAASYSQALAGWAREDMPLAFRFMAGDASTVPILASRGDQVLRDIGKLSDNRVIVDAGKFDTGLINYFAGVREAAPRGADLAQPFTRETAMAQEIAEDVNLYRRTNTGSPVTKAELDSWKEAKLDLIDDELAQLKAEAGPLSSLLGSTFGKGVEGFSVAESHGFGGLPRAYRMGTNVFSVNKAAEKKFGQLVAPRRGRYSTEGFRKGFFGQPYRILTSFGDRVPEGSVNHNDPDAGSRVLDMLKQVPGMDDATRATLLDRYMTAGDKVAKARALDEIHYDIINHMAIRVNGLDSEMAGIISGMVKEKTTETMQKLMGTRSQGLQTSQAFSGARREGGRTVDYVDDDGAWVVTPLARTQLSQASPLLPVRELERVLARNSGAMKTIKSHGGKAVDAVETLADGFNTLWKATTLLRPAYVPRMVSEELVASAVKFGLMARLAGDALPGMKNFVLNRGQWLWAELGKGSYVPTTGKGMQSKLAVVKLGNEEVAQGVRARKAALQAELNATTDPLKKAQLQGQIDVLKTERIRVSDALPVVQTRISMEQESLAKVKSQLAAEEKAYASIQASMQKPPTLGGGPGSATAVRQANALTKHADKIDALKAKIDDHQNVLDEFTDYYNEILRTAVASTGRRLGEGTFEAFGYQVPQAFSKEWANPISRDQISSDTAMSSMYARSEAVDKERLIKSGAWTYLTPNDPNHMSSWLNAINLQWGQDELFLKVMADPSLNEARTFLATPAGRAHLHDLGIRGRDKEQLLEDIQLTLDKYIPEESGLRAKVVSGEQVTEADIVSSIAREDFPTVHGEEILDKTRDGAADSVANVIDTIVESGFRRLGSIPSDVLSRHPVYLRFQEGHFKDIMKREIDLRKHLGKDESLTPDDLLKIRDSADKLARKDLSQVVYDPKRTTASEALRFVTPFYSAHADSLARWGGLIAEKPSMVGRIAQAYNAPVAAAMITDEYGNPVGKDGYATITDPVTGQTTREFVTMDKRVMHFRAPWKSKDEGSVPIKISALNTILPGDPWFNPGSGPLVQVAGSQIAKASPQMGDFLQWAKVLPYGPTETSTAVTPKWIRTIYEAYKGDDPDNEEYQKAYLAIWNKKQMEYLQSGGAKKFSQKDIEKEARDFLFLNMLEAWGSPAQSQNTPLTGTPYQFFVDQLGQMRKLDPENYRDNFLAKFGVEYAGFTASLNKSIGIAATISADQQAEKYADQIAADPDMAAFWIGDIYNGGPFSSSVYQKQMGQNFGAAMAREKITGEEAIEKNQTDTGWYEYRTMKNYLDSMLIREGFTSYTETGAEGYNDARKQIVAAISSKYPAWGNAFNSLDRSAVPNRIRSFEMAIGDEKLMSDPLRYEMPALVKYLTARREFKSILQERGLSRLSYDVQGYPTGESADIGAAWEQFKMGLINENVAFGDLYNRYLTNDDLQ